MNLQNHTSALPDHLYGPTIEGGLVQWPPTLTSALRGCLGVVAFVGIVSEIITMRRISSFMSSSSKPHPESTPTVRASRRPKDVDLEQHPQLLFSFSICDMLQCGLCAPLIIFRKLSDFDMAWSWSDAIFRTIGSSHLLVIIFKIRQKLVRMAEHTDKQTNTDTNSSSDHRQNHQLVESSKFEGVLEVFVLWLVSIFVISMIFMLCQALKYFASFENSDKILLMGVLVLAHFTPLLLLSFHGFKVRALRNGVIKSASERRQSSFSRHQHQNVHRDLSRLSDDSCTLMTTAGKNNTNFSTLSLAGSFTKRQRRSSWNSFRKKSGSSRNKNQNGEKMSPKLDRHPSLKYSIKRRRTSSLVDLNDFSKGRRIEEMPKPIDDQTHQQQHHHHHQQQNDDQFKSSQFLTVSLKRNNSNRSQKTKSFDRSNTDNQPRTKTRRRRLMMMMTTSPRTSASSGNESGKSSRSSSRSDRSSSSGRLERHPSLRFSTRNKTLRSQEVLDGWRKQTSDEECGKAKRRRRTFFRETGGSHEVLHKSFKTDKDRYMERHKFGGSMRMTEGKKIARKIGPRNAPMSRSHSHADHKKLTTLDRHPSLKFSIQKISIRSSTSKQILSEENMKGSTNKFDHSSKNHLILDGHCRHPTSFRAGSKSQKLTGTCGMTEDHKMAFLSQSHSYSTLRPDDQHLGRTSSCRGSFVRRTNDHHHHHHHHQHHHHHSSFRIPNSISNLHSNEMTFTPDDVTAPHLLPEKEVCHSRTSQAIEDSSWRGKRNLCFPSLEGVILSTLLLNLPVAMFFVLVFFIFNPSESSETPLVAHKLFSVCVSYAATTVRACIIFRSLS